MRVISLLSIVLLASTTLSAQAVGLHFVDTISHEMNCEDAMGKLDLFFSEITSNEPNVRGIAVYNEGSYREDTYSRGGHKISERLVSPVFGEAQRRVGWLQKYVNFRRFPKNRIAFVSGGYQANFSVELWLVPINSPNPKPKPNVKDMKFRKVAFTEFYCN